jgi:hypothetical protein
LICATLTLGNLLRHGALCLSSFSDAYLSLFRRSALGHPYKPPCQPCPRTCLTTAPRKRY